MKRRKLLSTVVASTLVATQLVIPAMAATGTLDVDVETKNVVIRVEVPTNLTVAVNEFESGDAGSQIYSTAFTMTNKSAVPVKVSVTSTLTADAGVTLVDSVDKVDTAGDAWLAIAAQTEAGKYGADLGDLTNTSKNVATFDTSTKKASQTFYLGSGSGEVAYKVLIPDAAIAAMGVAAYGNVFELTDETTALTDASANASTVVSDVISGKEIYAVVTASGLANGVSLEKVSETATYDSTKTYYSASATAASTLTASKNYVYAEQQTVGADGAAAFRYIGKLSEEKTGGWTKTDISQVSIAYDIQGVGLSLYDAKKDDCVYGLYTESKAPSIATKTYSMTANTAIDITVDLGSGRQGATTVSKVMDPTGVWDYLANGEQAVYDAGSKKLTLKAGMVDACIEANVSKVTVIFNDAAGTSIDITLTK